MTIHLLALQLMAVQGCLGAFDTLYHHELTQDLPHRDGAGRELAIHALRALLYSALFIGLSSWAFHGLWALVLLAIFGVEIGLTLWDFVVEDRTRLLPATERVTHTVLAMNGGAFVALLTLNSPAWLALPTALVWQPHGALGWFLALCGIGVGVSGVRDGCAARAVARRAHDAVDVFDFGARGRSFLVTGATGFIGRQLVRALLLAGQRVTVQSRQPRQAAFLFDGQVDCIARMADLAPSRRIDVVVNLAGARILGWRWSARRRAVLRRSRVALTAELVDWIGRARHKPVMLLSASAIGYYGVQARGDNRALDEETPPQPMFMSALCREWESAAQAARVHGVQVACMRFGVVLGRQGALPTMLLPIRLGLGGPLAGGAQWLSWIHVDDVLRALAHLCREGADGSYNFTAPEAVPQAQFSRVAASLHDRPSCLPTPGWLLRLVLGDQADLLCEGQRVLPHRLLASGFAFRYPALAPALRSLL